MKITKFPIEGVVLITPSKVGDERGVLSETYSARRFDDVIGPVRFVQDNHTLSAAAHTLRGLHFQVPPIEQGKLIRVVRGAVYDVAVDIRVGSPTYGRYVAVELNATNWCQFWVPPGFAHGFITLEPQTEVEYKLTAYYSPQYERGIAWNDPSLAIAWPIARGAKAILSPKDRDQPMFVDLPPYFN